MQTTPSLSPPPSPTPLKKSTMVSYPTRKQRNRALPSPLFCTFSSPAARPTSALAARRKSSVPSLANTRTSERTRRPPVARTLHHHHHPKPRPNTPHKINRSSDNCCAGHAAALALRRGQQCHRENAPETPTIAAPPSSPPPPRPPEAQDWLPSAPNTCRIAPEER